MASRLDFSQIRSLYIGTSAAQTVPTNNVIVDGNILIGTTTDSGERLTVAGSIVLNNTTYPSLALYTTSGTNFAITNRYTSNRLSIDVIGTGEIVNFLSSGYVGIGTTGPSSTLEVAGTLTLKSSAEGGPHIYRDGGNAGDVRFYSTNGTFASPTAKVAEGLLGQIHYAGYDGTSYVTGGQIWAIVDGAVSTGVMPTRLEFKTGTSGGGTTRMTINSGGYVGIGTNVPYSELQVQAAANTRLLLQVVGTEAANDNAGLFFKSAIHYSNAYIKGALLFSNAGVGNGIGDLIMATNNDANSTNVSLANARLIVKANGNVLIGTTTDNGRKLNVSGDIFASGEIYSNQYAAGRYIRYNWNTTNFTVGGGTATRWIIGRIYWNQVHWGSYSGMDIEIVWNYYNGARKKYTISNGAGGGAIYLRESQSYGSAYGRVSLGSAVDTGTTSGGYSNYYQDVYLEVNEYNYVSVNGELKGPTISIDKTSISGGEYGWATFFSSPSASTISQFTSTAATILTSENNWGYIDNKLGINVSNPDYQLDVYSANTPVVRISSQNSSGVGNPMLILARGGEETFKLAVDPNVGAIFRTVVANVGYMDFFTGTDSLTLRMSGNKNLLIGTTTDPGYRLYVSGSTGGQLGSPSTNASAFNFGDTSRALAYMPTVGGGNYNVASVANGSALFNTLGSDWWVGNHDGSALRFVQNSSLVFYTNSGARGAWTTTGLGIASTNPTTRIDAYGNPNATNGVIQATPTYGGGSYFTAFRARPSDTGDQGDYTGLFMGSISSDNALITSGSVYNSAGQYLPGGTTSTGIGMAGGTLTIFGNTGLTAGTQYAPTPRMVVVGSSGNVGIGVPSPGVKLDVNGAGRFVSDGASRVLYLKQDGNNSGNIVQFLDENAAEIWEITGRDNQFYIYNNAIGYSLAINPSTNNISIGTTTDAGYKLYVNGTGFFNNVLRASAANTFPIRAIATSGGVSRISFEDNVNQANDAVWVGSEGYNLCFGSNFSEQARISSSGNLIIGSTTDAGYKLDVYGEILGRDDIRILNTYALILNGTDANWRIGRNTITDTGWLTGNTMQMVVFGGQTGQGFQVVNTNGTALFEIDGVAGASRFTNALGVGVNPSGTSGRIDASNDIVAYSTSDQRLKENITPIANALDKVKALTGVEFDWKEDTKAVHGYEGHDVGVIAQEVQAVLPEAVRTNDSGYLSVRYEKMIALLVEANKELASRIEELEKKLK